jgi:hypothetical protein
VSSLIWSLKTVCTIGVQNYPTHSKYSPICVVVESGLMELELHVALFLKNSKMDFESFKTFGTKNLDMDNNVIY